MAKFADTPDVARAIGKAELWVNDTIELVDYDAEDNIVILTFDNGQQFAVTVEEV